MINVMPKTTHPLRVIVVSARKGGVGKSTLACHLSACAGPGAVLIDTDDQDAEGSSATWIKARAVAVPRFYSFNDFKQLGLKRLLATAAAEGATHVIVDTPPRADAAVADLMRLADVNVVVTEPSYLPLSALPRSLAIAQAAGKPTVLVLNKVKGQRLEAEQTREALAGIGAPLIECSDLAEFGRALATGQAVHEFSPRSKAAEQIGALWTQIQKLIP